MPNSTHGMLKPRDIREKLRGKIDPEIGKVLVKLCEDLHDTRLMVDEIVTMWEQMCNILLNMQTVVGALEPWIKAQAEAMRKAGSATQRVEQIYKGQENVKGEGT